jgi:large subunit ribosomal protein L6
MSRIGKKPINVPAKAKVSINGTHVIVEGPKGKIERTFDPAAVIIAMEDNVIHVSPKGDSRHASAMHGTVRATIQSMIKGAVEGFVKNLIINGVGFKAILKGKILELALGYSHPIIYPIHEGVTVTVTDATKVKVEGADKYWVGQVAADIKKFYPVEPYKRKGVTIEGQYVRTKEGKKTA